MNIPAPSPNPYVSVRRLRDGRVQLIGAYDDVMDVLVNFVGMTDIEAEKTIERLV